MFTVIPAIDLLNNSVVRLSQGDYNQVTHYNYTPAELAKLYEDNGATRIHIVDLNGAKDGKLINLDAIQSIRNTVNCTLELGGGIRTLESAKALFDLGLNILIIGSLLIKDPKTALEIIRAYPNKIVAGIDARDGKVAVEGWIKKSELDAQDLIKQLNNEPLESIIYTDISRDGMLTGPNIDELKRMADVSKHTIIASGGVSCMEDVINLRKLEPQGVNSCIIGKAIMANKINLADLF